MGHDGTKRAPPQRLIPRTVGAVLAGRRVGQRALVGVSALAALTLRKALVIGGVLGVVPGAAAFCLVPLDPRPPVGARITITLVAVADTTVRPRVSEIICMSSK